MEGGSGPGSCREPRSACGSHVPIDSYVLMDTLVQHPRCQNWFVIFVFFLFLSSSELPIYFFSLNSSFSTQKKWKKSRISFKNCGIFNIFTRISWIPEVLGAGSRFRGGIYWNSLFFIEIYWFFIEIQWKLLNFIEFRWISNGFPMKSIGIHKNPIEFIGNLMNFLLKTNKKQRSRAGGPGGPPLFANCRQLEPGPKCIFLSKGELRVRIEANSWCYEIVW